MPVRNFISFHAPGRCDDAAGYGVECSHQNDGTLVSCRAGKQEIEKERTQAELQNLKSQLNPHFLFNTLNNIYALVALNPQQAQYALHSLSQLLRYVLYDNNQQMMPLSKELAFIRSYVELMSLRLSKQVQLEVNLPEDDRGYQVAPLLFIALIENAFKHGVSATEPSFIHISFALTGGDTLICTVENSCFPKMNWIAADRASALKFAPPPEPALSRTAYSADGKDRGAVCGAVDPDIETACAG